MRPVRCLAAALALAPLLAVGGCDDSPPPPLSQVQERHCRLVATKLGRRETRHEIQSSRTWEVDEVRNVSVFIRVWRGAGSSRISVVKCRYPRTVPETAGWFWGTPKIKATEIQVNGQELSAAQTALFNSAIDRE